MGNFKEDQSKIVFTEIKRINPNVVLRKNIPFPENSFYKSRNRYRAESIIRNLKNLVGEDSVIVGLSNSDISTTKNKIYDWGVMDLGYNMEKAA